MTSELEEEITIQRNKQEQETLNMPGARERYIICQSCEKFLPALKACKVCYCFMPLKTRLQDQKCPKGYW